MTSSHDDAIVQAAASEKLAAEKLAAEKVKIEITYPSFGTNDDEDGCAESLTKKKAHHFSLCPPRRSGNLNSGWSIMDGNSTGKCPANVLADFSKSMGGDMLRVNALLVVNTILMGVMVGIGACVQRYRHHPLTRFLFLGATTLFLPIISYVVSTIGNQYVISVLSQNKIITGICSPRGHIFLVLVWTGLVQIVGINTTAVVAVDAREGRNIAPPVVLLVQAVWTSYLAVYTAGGGGQEGFYFPEFGRNVQSSRGLILFFVFALIFAKILFKYYAFYEAGRSFSLGRNPLFVATYMKLQGTNNQQGSEPPPLVIMGEDVVQRNNQPKVSRNVFSFCTRSYRNVRWMSNQDARAEMASDGLITMDEVWKYNHVAADHIDLCLSFALFKLLRCRFARYEIPQKARSIMVDVRTFFWNVLLKTKKFPVQPEKKRNVLLKTKNFFSRSGSTPREKNESERVFRLIADELSFLHDCYYSSHPISYSKLWLPILGIFISLLSIGYCLFVVAGQTLVAVPKSIWQIRCQVKCGGDAAYFQGFGRLMFDLVPVLFLIVIVFVAEARDIICYICSNWTKVALICSYFKHHDSGSSPTHIQKWVVGILLNCRCNMLVNPWVDKMNQCSILAPLRPRRRTPMAVFLRNLLHLPEQKKNVSVPSEVKTAFVTKLEESKETLSNGTTKPLCRSVHDGNLFWECSSNAHVAEIMLEWHVATSIFEVRHPRCKPPLTDSENKIIATHLSRYCAYLVVYSPELLPGYDAAWCKSLYKAVKKDAEHAVTNNNVVVVSRSNPEVEFGEIVRLLLDAKPWEEEGYGEPRKLKEPPSHEMLKKGAKLGKELAGLRDEDTAWKMLADFWLDILVYIAPSDHLDGHLEAIARGGELITLLWALFTHIGIVTRTRTDNKGVAATTSVDD